jgi:translation elongation factor EF-1alpha
VQIAAVNWKVKECTLASGREIEIVDVPGHPHFNKNAFIVRTLVLPREVEHQLTTTDCGLEQGASLADVAMLVVAAGVGEFEAGLTDAPGYSCGRQSPCHDDEV